MSATLFYKQANNPGGLWEYVDNDARGEVSAPFLGWAMGRKGADGSMRSTYQPIPV